MTSLRAVRTGLLAAASLMAATGAAQSSELLKPMPTETVAQSSTIVAETRLEAPAASEGDQLQIPHKWVIAAFATGALAALLRFLGLKRVAARIAAAAPDVSNAARVKAQAPVSVIRLAGEAIATPVKFAILFGGLGVLGFTGLGLLGIDGAGGLAICAVVAATWFGFARARQVLQPASVKPEPQHPVRQSNS